MNTAYMFPGQGSQFSGMGANLFARFPEECAQAERVVGYPIVEMCLERDASRLDETRHAQPAIFLVSCLDYLDRTRGSARPDVVLGHGVGLYAALFAAGVISLPEGLELVTRRAALMQQAIDGAMLRLVGKNALSVGDLLLRHEYADVAIASYDAPNEVVLSGPAAQIGAIEPGLREVGFECLRLHVTGAFHSRTIEHLRIELMRSLVSHAFRSPSIPVVSTTSGSVVSPEHLVEELGYQLVRPVRWLQTVRQLSDQSPEIEFVAIGPGYELSRLAQAIVSPDRVRT